MSTTNNHDYNVPNKGAYDGEWYKPLNENFRMIDEDMPMRGVERSRPGAGDIGRLYVATDSEVIYHDTGDGWNAVAGHDLQGSDLIDSENGTRIYNGSTGQISQDIVDDSFIDQQGDVVLGDLNFRGDHGLLELANADMDPLSSDPGHAVGRIVLTDGDGFDPDGDGTAELVVSNGVEWKEIVDMSRSL